MAERRHPNVVNVSEVESASRVVGRFGATRKNLGQAAGSTALGCTLHEVAPGRAAYPRHFHTANEEALYILEGAGTLQIGDAEVEVGPGDYVGLPVGPATAHRLDNHGTEPLRYLAFSTMNNVEVVGYPDSAKVGAVAAPSLRGAFNGGEVWLMHIGRQADAVGYFDGEDTGDDES